MARNGIVLLGGGAVAASYFLPWLAVPSLLEGGPHDVVAPLVEQFGYDGLLAEDGLLAQVPWEGLALAATFPVSALLVILALMRSAPAWLALLCGAVPFALVGLAYLQRGETTAQFGLPPLPDQLIPFDQFMELAQQFVGVGLWAYLAGSLLLIIGSFAPRGSY